MRRPRVDVSAPPTEPAGAVTPDSVVVLSRSAYVGLRASATAATAPTATRCRGPSSRSQNEGDEHRREREGRSARAGEHDREEDRRGHRAGGEAQRRTTLAQRGDDPDRERRQQQLGVVVGVRHRPVGAPLAGLADEVRDVESGEAEVRPVERLRHLLEHRHGGEERRGRQHRPHREAQHPVAAQRVEDEEVEQQPLDRERRELALRDLLVASEGARGGHREQQRDEQDQRAVHDRPATGEQPVGERDREHERDGGGDGDRQAMGVHGDDGRVAEDQRTRRAR